MAKRKNTSTSGDATSTEKSKYETMIIGISAARKPQHTELSKLAESLGCKPSALVWEGIDRVLKDPPKNAPAGAARGAVGSAAGFWTVPIMQGKPGQEKAVGMQIVEVGSRADVQNGRVFFRFSDKDAKSRDRAKAQAIRAAQYDLNLLGIKSQVEIKELKKAA